MSSIEDYAIKVAEAGLPDSTLAEKRLRLIKELTDENANLKREIETLDKRVAHLVGREVHFSRVLGVPDAGQYRNDWTGRLEDLLADREALRITRGALAQADAETVALADAFRSVLEGQHMPKVTAALFVQEIINNARKRGE
jgi:hypothetical protein